MTDKSTSLGPGGMPPPGPRISGAEELQNASIAELRGLVDSLAQLPSQQPRIDDLKRRVTQLEQEAPR